VREQVKQVDINIPNKDSFEAIQLCIESIRRYTRYSNYKIVVHDDFSSNKVDLEYLEKAQDNEWITLHKNTTRHEGHGGGMNALFNEHCASDLAITMDCDVAIREAGWLSELVDMISGRNDVLAIIDTYPKYYTPVCYRLPMLNIFCGLINMKAYRDDMQFNWLNRREDRRQEPFKSIFAPFYPPSQIDGLRENFDENRVSIDPGANFWLKAFHDNPKNYKIVNLPHSVRRKFHHFGHVSCIALPDFDNVPRIRQVRDSKFKQIREELQALRGR